MYSRMPADRSIACVAWKPKLESSAFRYLCKFSMLDIQIGSSYIYANIVNPPPPPKPGTGLICASSGFYTRIQWSPANIFVQISIKKDCFTRPIVFYPE